MSLTRFHCANSLGVGPLPGPARKKEIIKKKKKTKVIGTGFEPVPPKRLVPETSALDRSATQPLPRPPRGLGPSATGGHFAKIKKLHHGESNPGHLRDRQRCYQLHHDGRER